MLLFLSMFFVMITLNSLTSNSIHSIINSCFNSLLFCLALFIIITTLPHATWIGITAFFVGGILGTFISSYVFNLNELTKL